MIKRLSIKNFKSIKEIDIECKKINLFIGEPNSGKSNILEALGVLNWCGYMTTNIRDFVRFEGLQNLFYDDMIEGIIELEINKNLEDSLYIAVKSEGDDFVFEAKVPSKGNLCRLDREGRHIPTFKDTLSGEQILAYRTLSNVQFIKFYKFVTQSSFPDSDGRFLFPPNGANMYSVLRSHKNIGKIASDFFHDFGFELVLRAQDKTFEILKRTENFLVAYPYILTSDTLQRIIFYRIAMESNENSTLVFEEPESHAFPYYTKYLGETIAFDETNQYFIATHNPYLLLSILEKADRDSVNVFVTYFKNYQTRVKCLNEKEKSEIIQYDPFFNLNSFLEDDDEEAQGL